MTTRPFCLVHLTVAHHRHTPYFSDDETTTQVLVPTRDLPRDVEMSNAVAGDTCRGYRVEVDGSDDFGDPGSDNLKVPLATRVHAVVMAAATGAPVILGQGVVVTGCLRLTVVRL